MNQPVPQPDVSHFSASSLREYVTCPKKWTLHRIERVAPAFRPVAFAFGTAWHHAIGYHLECSTPDAPVSVDELIDLFGTTLDAELVGDIPVLFEDDETPDTLTEKARQMMAVFQRDVPLPETVIGTELAFSATLFEPDTGEELVPLVGSIDAIVDQNHRPTVWELKTSKRKWGQDQLEFDMQSTCYRLGAQNLGYEDPAIQLVVTTKSKQPSVQIDDVVRHPRDEDELAELAASVLRGVRAGYDARIRGWQCRSCPYAHECDR